MKLVLGHLQSHASWFQKASADRDAGRNASRTKLITHESQDKASPSRETQEGQVVGKAR